MRWLLSILLATSLHTAPLAVEFHTVVHPLANEDILSPCAYDLWLGAADQPARGVWVIFERGQDSLRFYLDNQVRRFASEHQLALMLPHHCRSKEREDMDVDPSLGIGRALFQALDQFADAAGRREFRTCQVMVLGWSGAGSLVARLPAYAPDRVRAVMAYAPGQYDPLGMDTIELSEKAAAIPQLVIANGADTVNGTAKPYAYFLRHWSRGSPWTFIVQNRMPHCCLQTAQPLILAWVQGVLQGQRTKQWPLRFGLIQFEESSLSDTWHLPVSNISSARVSTERMARKNGARPSGLLPSARFAHEWLRYARLKHPKNIWRQ